MRMRRMAAYGATAVVLLGVFALYLRPEFMVGLAQQLWACF